MSIFISNPETMRIMMQICGCGHILCFHLPCFFPMYGTTILPMDYTFRITQP